MAKSLWRTAGAQRVVRNRPVEQKRPRKWSGHETTNGRTSNDGRAVRGLGTGRFGPSGGGRPSRGRGRSPPAPGPRGGLGPPTGGERGRRGRGRALPPPPGAGR